MRRHAAAAATLAAAVVGWLLVWAAAVSSSATYDETTYLNAAARWWRTGDPVGITRMGTPNLFWKAQLAPTYLALDLSGRGDLIADQPGRQAELLPIARLGASWIWLAGLAVSALWARNLNGPWAMAFAAWLYALSPNLIAHGSLVTMEVPLTVATAATFLAFGSFLATGRRRWFWASAALCGLAFACKFTAIVYPPILGVVWWLHDRSRRALLRKGLAMAGFVAAMLAADFALTGFATLPLSPHVGDHPSATGRFAGLISRAYETPIPQDWVGFATQMKHQATGGPSYLLGERRMWGWRHYYLVALAVKVPLAFWLLAGARFFRDGLRNCLTREPDKGLLQAALLFFLVASIGSSRNYGVRYLLPMAPLAIVWLSRLASDAALAGVRGRAARVVVSLGLIGQAIAVASVFPHELTYFNPLAGGRGGGRYVLADSNLDWGQGLRSLRRLQDERPEFRDLTLYYFGDVDPAAYGVAGVHHVVDAVGAWPEPPPLESATTGYLGVSASLQHGPWGPDGFFRPLDGRVPVATTDDGTIAVYRVRPPVRLMSDLP